MTKDLKSVGRAKVFNAARITFHVDKSVKEQLKQIQSVYSSMSMSELLRHSLRLLSAVHETKTKGGVVVIRDPSGFEKQLLI